MKKEHIFVVCLFFFVIAKPRNIERRYNVTFDISIYVSLIVNGSVFSSVGTIFSFGECILVFA
jgi:hypothetical protein